MKMSDACNKLAELGERTVRRLLEWSLTWIASAVIQITELGAAIDFVAVTLRSSGRSYGRPTELCTHVIRKFRIARGFCILEA